MNTKTIQYSPLFSNEVVNKGRQIELDIARALAVVFMIFVHVQGELASSIAQDSIFGLIIDFMGGIPAAPVFMFLMGLGFMYSSKSTPVQLIKRGFKILGLGYLLNFLRESLPELIDYWLEGEQESLTGAAQAFIDVDILQFAGMSMIFFGVVKYFRISISGICSLGLLLASLHFVLKSFQTTSIIGSAISGLFWGSNSLSDFPFINWICYPIMGYVFAHFLLRCTNTKLLYKKILQVSGISFLVLSSIFVFNLEQGLGMESELGYYHHNLLANMVYGFFVLFWISLIFWVSKRIPNLITQTLSRWSRNVTEIYFIHWILLGWFSWAVYGNKYSIGFIILLSILLLIVSDYLSQYLKQRNIRLG